MLIDVGILKINIISAVKKKREIPRCLFLGM